GGADDVGGRQELVARLDRARSGDEREVLAADLSPGDLEDGRFLVLDLRGGELVGLEDRDDAVDARRSLELKPGDVLAIADRADHGHLLAAARMRMSTNRLDALDDGVDLVRRRRLFHDDHHLECLPGYAFERYEWSPAEGVSRPFHGARPVGPLWTDSLRADEAGRAPS